MSSLTAQIFIMKKIFSFLLLTIIMLFVKADVNAQTNPKLLRHIVTITFKQDAKADSIKALDDVYISLSKNAMVKDFEWVPRDGRRSRSVFYFARPAPISGPCPRCRRIAACDGRCADCWAAPRWPRRIYLRSNAWAKRSSEIDRCRSARQ